MSKKKDEKDGDDFDELDKLAAAGIISVKGFEELSEQLEEFDTAKKSNDQDKPEVNTIMHKFHSHSVLIPTTILMAAIMIVRFIMSDPSPEAIFGVIAFMALFGVLYLVIDKEMDN